MGTGVDLLGEVAPDPGDGTDDFESARFEADCRATDSGLNLAVADVPSGDDSDADRTDKDVGADETPDPEGTGEEFQDVPVSTATADLPPPEAGNTADLDPNGTGEEFQAGPAATGTGDLPPPEAADTAVTRKEDSPAREDVSYQEYSSIPLAPPPMICQEDTLAFERGLLGSILGDCLLDLRIGRGAVGSVFKADHIALHRVVAVKILNPSLFYLKRHVDQFFREARSAATLEHEGVVAVYHVGQERGLYFIVMQYVEGETVADLIEREGRLSVPEALRITTEAARALAVAHENDVIHRDIKPSNLLLTKRGRVKVADFGLASRISETQRPSGRSEVAGTPFYIPPEQISGGSVDQRADLYSLGVTLYFALTGQRPFEGDTPKEVLIKHLTQAPVPVNEIDPSLDPGLTDLIQRLLAKKPAARPDSASDLVHELEALARDLEPVE
jgi:tRNA A-37 threonylcarbamoyl transferase component Bud32